MLGNRLAGRVGAMLLAVGLLCACGATATPSPATPSPTANADEVLMADLAALWGGAYDAAKVAALYAPNAVFRDMNANETSTGLEEIQAKVEKYAALDFKVTNTSAPIRQDNIVAVFQRFGQGEATYPGLGVVELKDGKVVNMWAYPAASSPAASSPAAVDDEALMTDVNAVWGGTYDAARVAALYAPNATFYDMLPGKTFKGLEAIQAKVEANASANSKCTQTSASIRQDNFVAVFHRFSTGGATYPVLAVFELKDSKVINQWAYPAP